MSCTFCTPRGWQNATCDYCGGGSEGRLYAVLMFATGEDTDHPYEQTSICYECWANAGQSLFNYAKASADKRRTTGIL